MTGRALDGPVVVTGGAGAIGSVLVRDLLDRAGEVRVIDNLSSGRREHLLPSPGGRKALLTVADLKNPAWYADLFRGASAVWHLATNPDIRKGMTDPRLDLEEGTLATFHVLEAARRHDVPRVAFSSSSVVYGLPTVFPTPEEVRSARASVPLRGGEARRRGSPHGIRPFLRPDGRHLPVREHHRAEHDARYPP